MEIITKFNERLRDELSKLIDIAEMRDFKLNYATIVNLLQENNSTNNFQDVVDYFNQRNIEIVFDDVEVDNMDDSIQLSSRIKPFDQTKIDITMKQLTLDLVIKRLKNCEINLMPDFQRKAGLWDQQKKSRLIESLILRIPLPAFYFDGTNAGEWLVIDGLQRLTAIKEFFVDFTLKLKDLEFLTDYENCSYSDLPRTYTRRMEETQLVTYIINPGTPLPVTYNIFKRINTAGLKLEPQEIRHALYQGKATKLLKELVENKNFLIATGRSIKGERMLDREFVLRFLAFREYGITKYEGYLDDFLNNTMELLNNYNEDQLEELKLKFDNAMILAYDIFGDKAFRKVYSMNDSRRNPINRALFEIWSVAFSMLSDKESMKIRENKEFLLEKFINLMNDNNSNFDIDITSGKVTAVKRRFEEVDRIIKEVLNHDISYRIKEL